MKVAYMVVYHYRGIKLYREYTLAVCPTRELALKYINKYGSPEYTEYNHELWNEFKANIKYSNVVRRFTTKDGEEITYTIEAIDMYDGEV